MMNPKYIKVVGGHVNRFWNNGSTYVGVASRIVVHENYNSLSLAYDIGLIIVSMTWASSPTNVIQFLHIIVVYTRARKSSHFQTGQPGYRSTGHQLQLRYFGLGSPKIRRSRPCGSASYRGFALRPPSLRSCISGIAVDRDLCRTV